MSWFYDVGLSYAGPQREVAERIYDELWKRGYSVFYDRDRPERLVGGRLGKDLRQIFEEDCRACVLLLSGDYERNEWTALERDAILARSPHDDGFVLPVLLSGTRPAWLGDRCAVECSATGDDVVRVADLISAKIEPSATCGFGALAEKVEAHLRDLQDWARSQSRWTQALGVDLFALPIRISPEQPAIRKEGIRNAADYAKLGRKRLVILGRPGSGKSTLVHRLFATSTGQTKLIPVDVHLWDLEKRSPAIRKQLMDDLDVTAAELALLEDRNALLLVFDGLDEAKHPEKTLRRLLAITEREGALPSANLLVTCRTEDYPSSDPHERTRTVSILNIAPLTDGDRCRFFEEMHDTALAADLIAAFANNRKIAAMCSNQFMFLMLAGNFRSTGRLPATRAEVYRNFLRSFLRDWSGLSASKSDRLEKLIKKIAVRIANGGPNATSVPLVTLHRTMPVTEKDIRDLRKHGLLARCHERSVKFAQRTLQEYLHAKWLYDEHVALKEFRQVGEPELKARRTWISRNTARFCLEISGLIPYATIDDVESSEDRGPTDP